MHRPCSSGSEAAGYDGLAVRKLNDVGESAVVLSSYGASNTEFQALLVRIERRAHTGNAYVKFRRGATCPLCKHILSIGA